ncbi:uncharacterized protein BJX67DRAFT_373470 [Aspergillus lucknowensis]|uniref:Uncharacterized protein n=1 Tax=Aspergillus lucknowensis TaxID=176173 RepID=A0ABR4LKU6_9EURO
MSEDIQLQILSDLHLESPAAYDIFNINPKTLFLALLGDIGYEITKPTIAIGRRQSLAWRRFKHDISEASRRGEALGKLVLLDQTRYNISPTLTILGCTLFSCIIEEQKESVSFGLNDFYHIRDWSIEAHREAHFADLSWLNKEIDSISSLEPGRKEVVDPKHSNSKLSSGFMTNLSNEHCWQSEIVTLWAFGHTRFNCDFRDLVTGKRVIANQRGYYFSQSTGCDPERVVELEDI